MKINLGVGQHLYSFILISPIITIMFPYHRVMYSLTENTDFNNLIAMIPWKYLMTNLCLLLLRFLRSR